MLLDSNILIYSINSSSPKHKKAQKFIQENTGSLEIAHQNIFESLCVLTHSKFPHPMKINDATRAIESILKGTKVISPSYRTHRIALELIKKYQLISDQIFDAYLVATALDNGIYTIATDNIKDFVQLAEVKIISPFS
ncbi:PIN domain-containing protein [Candidatus Curtissbacteria bacterium]|nr:PIN domain-containing protein [Candidatus Curtissbacteria bacterium]